LLSLGSVADQRLCRLPTGGCKNRLTPLTGLSFAFIIAGVVFGDERVVGYGLMGVGLILALVDILTRSRSE
jgi:hypothetical protein